MALGLLLIWSIACPTIATGANPLPFVNQPLVPASAAPGGQAFTLTVNGTGFVSGATVNWNGTPLTTKFVSSSQLTAAISNTDIATPQTALVTVTNPGPPVLKSNFAYFEVTTPEPSVAMSEESYPPGQLPFGIATGDFNGDGKLDLAVVNGGSNSVSVFLGNGDGTFKAPVTYSTGAGPQSVLTGDFNGDGILDLAVVNATDQTVSVLLGNGDGTFQSSPSPRLSASLPSRRWRATSTVTATWTWP